MEIFPRLSLLLAPRNPLFIQIHTFQ